MFKPSWKSIAVSSAILVLSAFGIKYSLAITPFTPNLAPIGYVAQDDVTNYDLRGNTEVLFRAEYQKQFWDGNLYAYPVASDGTVNLGAERWSGGAAAHITAQNFDTGRYIATLKDNGSKIAFRWANLSTAQQTSLATVNNTSTVVDYLRGDRSNEKPTGALFRQRASAMGDVVHSRPYYVADATNPTIFVGANDGMMHAINADTGDERWAYVPSMLISKLKNLSTDPYVHDYFVDGQITIGNIASATKRILVGSLGGGGKGIYALDVTGSSGLTASSEADAATKALWEISPSAIKYNGASSASTSYANLGYSYGTPIIDKLKSGTTVTDIAVFGNGYNDTGDYKAYLYIANANTGQLIRALQAGTSGSATNINGLFNAQLIDTNGDGSADIAYAGDLNGTMWKFDLTGTNSPVAVYTTSPVQPITGTPGVGAHPNGGYMVNFGTGSMLTSSDASDTSVFYAYGIWDGAPAANTNIVAQTLTTKTATFTASVGVISVRTVTTNTVTWTSGNDKGWKVAMPAGEKLVGEGSYLANSRFYFAAYNPTVSTPIGTTGASIQGTNWLMELDYLTGGTKNAPFLDVSTDGILNNSDRLTNSSGAPILTTAGIPVGKFIALGVMSQPILLQLSSLNDTLFNQNPDILPPAIPSTVVGVAGGHFDVDIYYATSNSGKVNTVVGDTCTNKCKYVDHVHQYDKSYNVTGVNTLNPSNTADNLAHILPSADTPFKLLVHNQYLNPAVKLNIGNANYLFNIDAGYTSVKDYQTSSTLSLSSVPTYTRNTVGSLAFNMPVDALSSKDWWGNGDIRSGLIPTVYSCVWAASGANDGNMYQPVNPAVFDPTTGTDTSAPSKGWSNATTPATATGARHNGALTLQIIRSTTPDSAIELNVVGRPEFGWRVKSTEFSNWVLGEYNAYWHHPNGKCYGDAGWVKNAPADNTTSNQLQGAAGATDPHIGNLAGTTGGSIVSVVTTVTSAGTGAGTGGSGTNSGAGTKTVSSVSTTKITYSNGAVATIVVTTYSDNTKQTVTTDASGRVTTVITADPAGSVKTGGDESGVQSKTGRLSWQELIKP